jgi:hypothetical protein
MLIASCGLAAGWEQDVGCEGGGGGRMEDEEEGDNLKEG